MRRRLSLDTDIEEPDRLVADRTRKSNLRERLSQKMNLQICFVDNDDQESPSAEEKPISSHGYSNSNGANGQASIPSNGTGSKYLLSSFNLTSLFPKSTSKSNQSQFNSFQSYLDHLHTEAKKSLKAAKEMSQMQSQLEREQQQQCNPIQINAGDDDQELNPTNKSVITDSMLRNKSKKRLQLMEGDLIKKTTELNFLLVKLLEERDDLLMEQDSLLIDIEDLTQFL